ncbi:hypothetical protein GGF46_004485 [Coemansia sp. RSA 552]|nr:hypothetical protein GGF46_004485 [Coemansia sp. RSA 552]
MPACLGTMLTRARLCRGQSLRQIQTSVANSPCSSDGPAIAPITYDTPLPEMKQWYESIRTYDLVPTPKQLDHLLGTAQRLDDCACWEPIVRQDVQLFMDRVADARQRRQYARAAGSLGVASYCRMADVGRAADCFNWVIRAGSYPTTTACAALLSLLDTTELPIPVLLQGWTLAAKPICGLKPTYPPRGKLPDDKFIVARNQHQRGSLVAQVGMALFYAQVRHKAPPTEQFYLILAVVLGRTRLTGVMQHIFENVIPKLLGERWHAGRDDPMYNLTAPVWMALLSNAVRDSDGKLAMRWFRMYRKKHVPRLKQAIAAPKPGDARGLQEWTQLYEISRPYYAITRITRPLLPDGSVPKPWYCLESARLQVKMDQQRESDQLPLSVQDAQKMLQIYAMVDELRDMAMAEEMAATVSELSAKPNIPQSACVTADIDRLFCWQMMVEGYCRDIRACEGMGGHNVAGALPDDMLEKYRRLRHWHQIWAALGQKLALPVNDHHYSRSVLSSDNSALVKDVCLYLNTRGL